MLGMMEPPVNYGLVLLGLVYTAWWALTIGLIVAGLAVRTELIEHIWPPITYLYMFFSGFFFMAAWLPLSLRNIVLAIDPPVHCYEIIRSGYFGNRIQTFYDIGYLTFLLLVLTLIGLWLMQGARKHLELE
jgi:capsular polysaccharide transport system permease protein